MPDPILCMSSYSSCGFLRDISELKTPPLCAIITIEHYTNIYLHFHLIIHIIINTKRRQIIFSYTRHRLTFATVLFLVLPCTTEKFPLGINNGNIMILLLFDDNYNGIKCLFPFVY